jgi:hypothetical protein
LREEITDALGVDIDTARRWVASLLARPHEAVHAALAAWYAPGLTGLARWRSELPSEVTTGDVPTQEQADVWARDNTLGLIDSFPVQLEHVVVLLASALATKVTWLRPFDLTEAAQLRSPWSRQLTQVLHAPAELGHHARILATQRAGHVGVHTALADHHLDVTSVIAAEGVSRADVLAVAHEIATASPLPDAPEISLFDLPLGDGPLWTITEQHADYGGQRIEAVLPAWHAATEYDLLSAPSLGFGAAGQSLLPGGQVRAAQTAVAEYTQRGFAAAAVTALAMTVSGRVAPPPGPYRTATLRFGHPYAVVATTRAIPGSPWDGLPVFAAWISDPDDASAE